jgi:hypothetical protein
MLLITITYKHSVCTSQRREFVLNRKASGCVMYRELMVVCCKNHTEHINTRCGQNAGLLICLDSDYSNHKALKGSGVPRNFFRRGFSPGIFFEGGGGGWTKPQHPTGPRHRRSGGCSPLVRGSTQFANE